MRFVTAKLARVVVVAAVIGAGLAMLGGTANAAFSGTDGKLVFYKVSSDGDAGPPSFVQIFSMNRPGNGQKNLSAKGGGASQVDIQPSVSPDGKTIAFARLDQDTGSAQLWTMTFEGRSRPTSAMMRRASASQGRPSLLMVRSCCSFGSLRGRSPGPGRWASDGRRRDLDSQRRRDWNPAAGDDGCARREPGHVVGWHSHRVQPSSRRSAAHLRHERERGGRTGRPWCRLEAGLVARWNSSRVRAGRWWIRDGRERLESGRQADAESLR